MPPRTTRIRASQCRNASAANRRMGGFTIIELMVAMVLGLILIIGVGSAFIANQHTYKSNKALSDLEDTVRMAFMLMTQDIRQAAGTGCTRAKNGVVIGSKVTGWWEDWSKAVHGDDHSIEIIGVTGAPANIKTDNGASLELIHDTDALHSGDLVMICSMEKTAMAKVESYDSGDKTVTFAHPPIAGYDFPTNSQISRLTAVKWAFDDDAGALTRKLFDGDEQEIVRHIHNMQITYHEADTDKYIAAGDVSHWTKVDSIHIEYEVKADNKSTNANDEPLKREFGTTISIRNRVS